MEEEEEGQMMTSQQELGKRLPLLSGLSDCCSGCRGALSHRQGSTARRWPGPGWDTGCVWLSVGSRTWQLEQLFKDMVPVPVEAPGREGEAPGREQSSW